MRDLEERSDAESLGEICAQSGECVVCQENIALDLSRNVVDGSRV